MARDMRCKDCWTDDFDPFIVQDSLWVYAGLYPLDFCCRPCFEKRIQRSLTFADYTICPLNLKWVDGFGTEDNYRALYTQDGLDYDKIKSEYFDRCRQNWGIS